MCDSGHQEWLSHARGSAAAPSGSSPAAAVARCWRAARCSRAATRGPAASSAAGARHARHSRRQPARGHTRFRSSGCRQDAGHAAVGRQQFASTSIPPSSPAAAGRGRGLQDSLLQPLGRPSHAKLKQGDSWGSWTPCAAANAPKLRSAVGQAAQGRLRLDEPPQVRV